MRLKGKRPIFNVKDVWNLDRTLSPVICEGLRKFKEVIQNEKFSGYPSQLIGEEYSGVVVTDDNGVEIWHRILDQMIYAFDLDNEPNIADYDFHMEMVDVKIAEGGLKHYSIENTNEIEYERYKEDCKEHQDNVKLGLELFGKYFQSLWY